MSSDLARTTFRNLEEWPTLSDAEVVTRVCAGELELFEIVMRRHNQRLFRVVRAITRDDADAEDAVQQAYISAYEHLDQFAGTSPFSTWLTRIAIREGLKRARKRVHLSEIELTDEEVVTKEVVMRFDPEEQASQREITRLLESEVNKLPLPHRLVFMMREVQQMTTAETASCLDLTDDAVKVRLHRAKALLRAAISRSIDQSAAQAFAFLGTRCNRLVHRVMSALKLPGRAPLERRR
jgi:RNA polymerase sigma-70 factor (ECF subfamily)